MSDAIESFFAAWGMSDATARAAAIRNSLAPAFHYADPRTPDPITAVDAMIDYVAMYTQYAPGASAGVVAQSKTLDHIRVTVAFRMADGNAQHGQYFIEQDAEGRLVRLIGFAGLGEPA